MTTVATAPLVPGGTAGDGQGMGHVPHPTYAAPTYRAAYSYLAALVRGQAPLRETKAITSTAILESHRKQLTDSIVVFEPAALARREAEAWMRAIGHTDHEAA
jgi:hypothetical protein